MTDEEARSLLKKAHGYSRMKFVNKQDGQDYAQQAILQYLERPESNQRIEYAVLDARRSVERKQRSRFYREWIVENPVLAPNRYECTALEAMICHEILDELSPEERIALKLYYGYEFRLTEIARILDTSESQLSILISKTLKRVRARDEL